MIAPAPLGPRSRHVAVWTGREMLVWGGDGSDAAAYDPASDTWRVLPPSPFPARVGTTAVWTGSEMLLWGCTVSCDDRGAAFDPARNTWRTLAPGPRARVGQVGVWTGRELVVWGGQPVNPYEPAGPGVAYDPAADRWRELAAGPLDATNFGAAAWTGQEMIVFQPGDTWQQAEMQVAAYHPATPAGG
jgi:hypothetical protein